MNEHENSKESGGCEACGFSWERGGVIHVCGLHSGHAGNHECDKPLCLAKHANEVMATDKSMLNDLYGELADAIHANDFGKRDKLFSQICNIVNKR